MIKDSSDKFQLLGRHFYEKAGDFGRSIQRQTAVVNFREVIV
jgi:hypothetical protein